MSEAKTKGVWQERWERLHYAGLSRTQAEVVYEILDDARAFHSETLAETAHLKLEQVFGPWPTEGGGS